MLAVQIYTTPCMTGASTTRLLLICANCGSGWIRLLPPLTAATNTDWARVRSRPGIQYTISEQARRIVLNQTTATSIMTYEEEEYGRVGIEKAQKRKIKN